MKIAILGATGPAGKGLAARLATAGMKVYAGSRDAQKAEATVGQLYDRFGHPMSRIEAGSNAEVAEAAEIVLLATTADAAVATAAEHAAAMAGKVVVSMANVMRKVEAGFEAVPVDEGSTAQAVQAAAPDALVAAAFHHVPAAPLLALDRPMTGDVVVVSDHDVARRITSDLITAIPDLRTLDGGPLANAVALEAFCAVILTVNLRQGDKATLRLTSVG